MRKGAKGRRLHRSALCPCSASSLPYAGANRIRFYGSISAPSLAPTGLTRRNKSNQSAPRANKTEYSDPLSKLSEINAPANRGHLAAHAPVIFRLHTLR